MANNQFFSLRRFGALVGKSIGEGWKSLALTAGALLVLMIAVGIFVTRIVYRDYMPEDQFSARCINAELIWFSVIMMISGFYFSTVAFKSMANPRTALGTLMTPASQFEKYLLKLLTVVPLFILTIFLFGVVADYVRVAYARIAYDAVVQPVAWTSALFDENVRGFVIGSGWHTVNGLVLLQSFGFLGSIVWPKHSMLKTIVAVAVVGIAYFCAYVLITASFAKQNYFYSGFTFDNEMQFATVLNTLLVVVMVVNYVLAYMRFRESEIINRW